MVHSRTCFQLFEACHIEKYGNLNSLLLSREALFQGLSSYLRRLCIQSEFSKSFKDASSRMGVSATLKKILRLSWQAYMSASWASKCSQFFLNSFKSRFSGAVVYASCFIHFWSGVQLEGVSLWEVDYVHSVAWLARLHIPLGTIFAKGLKHPSINYGR